VTWVLLVLIIVAQVDVKGSIPVFILNNWNDGFIKEVKEYHLDALGHK
jgi:hypothetical protein